MLQPPLDPPTARPALLVRWLWVIAAMIVAMVVVGGITRLTESGLSITEWKPLSGAIPPLSDAQWRVEFDHYKQIGQYQKLNQGMTLAAFKGIFFWEYAHRLLGRLIGMVFALPLIWFAVRRQIPRGYRLRLVALLALGGLQGAFGWWMVKSGLDHIHTSVSHVWLMAHLLLALFTLGGIVWTALDLRALSRTAAARPARLTGLGAGALLILFLQLGYGALMAGLDAGLVTNEWPLMNGRLAPTDVLGNQFFANAAINNPEMVHFIHRWWAWVAFAALMILARAAKRAGVRPASVAIHATVGIQILLGIATVLAGVPIWLAALHQLVGALLVMASVYGAHAVGRR